jgi:hypothetical protein
MFQCASSSYFPMKADIYTSTNSQNASTGKIVKSWVIDETVSCSAIPGQSRTSLGEGSFLKPGGINEYTDLVKLRTKNAIPIGKMVRNIRNDVGVIWTEADDRSGSVEDTMFEVRGNGPILDLNATVICYEMILSRMDVQ